jgi:hypothetical protein
LEVTDATVAVNVPLINPAPIARFAGTVIALFVLETATGNPLAGAGALSDTVQVEVPGALTVEGEHETELGTTGCRIVRTPLDPLDVILFPLAVDETVPVNCSEVVALVVPGAT